MAVKEATKAETKKEESKVKASVKDVVTVKANALSVDVAPHVLASMDKVYKDEAKVHELTQAIEGKRYDMLAQLTSGILKAAQADDSIDLTAAFSGDNKRMNVLNDQLGLALGFRELTDVPATDKVEAFQRIGYAKAVQRYFPGAKDDKTTAEYKRKNTLRSNFLTMVKKCAQTASGIIATDTKVTVNKDAGTLQISGPAVQKTFGQETVLLNEKQTVGEGENAVKLAMKPSFTAVGRMGAEAAGKVLEVRKDSRTGQATDPAVAIQQIAKSLADACAKLKGVADEETKRALSIAQSAIDKVLQAK